MPPEMVQDSHPQWVKEDLRLTRAWAEFMLRQHKAGGDP